MKGMISTALALTALALAGTAAASEVRIHKSGDAYHVAVCPGPAAPGTVRCHARIVTDAKGAPLVRTGKSEATPAGYGPADLRAAYGITGSGAASTLVAVVDAYGYSKAEADLAVYRAQYGLPPCTTENGCFKKVNESGVQGKYPAENTSWAQETALDLDMVSAMCPNCSIVLVEASSTSNADLAKAVNTAATLGAHVISNSYGGSETGTKAYEAAYNHPGVAITASTGDSGYGASFPATSPHVTAVGGTTLSRAGNPRGYTETAWSEGGSGCSQIYPKPPWQLDKQCAMRMEADVSAVADPSTGVAVYGPVSSKSSGWEVFGGTSVAAPLIGGVYGVNGGPVTYGSDPYNHTASLNDITAGSNGGCDVAYFCTAGIGYDGPTGLGTPRDASPF